MKLRSLCVQVVLAAVLTVTAPWLCAQDGLTGALTQAIHAAPATLRAPLAHTLAVADFDGDNQPDGAVLVDNGSFGQPSLRKIEVHFTARGKTDLAFESSETTLAISALDVNHDGAIDIVVEQPFTHKRLKVWLNDGRGGFRSVRNEDSASANISNRQRLGRPLHWPDSLALCLPSQSTSEIAIITANLPLHSSSAAREQTALLAAPLSSRELSPNSPRSPPLISAL